MPLKPNQPTAADLAGLCLDHLAQDPEQLAGFMGVSGLTPDGLRRGIGTAGFQRGLIDYFAQNEPLLMALCAANNMAPESFMRVWAKLNPAG